MAPVRSWDVAAVGAWLADAGLGALAPAFRDNAVSGDDLLDLEDADFTGSLGCTPLQVKKIRKLLAEADGGAPAPAPAAAPAAAKAEGAAPAPVDASTYAYPPAPAGYPAAAAAAGGGSADAAKPPAAPAAEGASAEELAAKAAEARGHAATYAAAAARLARAQENLASAAKALKITQVSAATEMMGDLRFGGMRGGGGMRGPRGGIGFGPRGGIGGRGGRGDFMHNAVEMATARKAQTQVKAAGEEIAAAQAALPTIPFIKAADVKAAMTGVMLNAFLMPGLVGDVMQIAKTKKCQAELEAMLKDTQQALAWATNNQQGAAAAAAALGAQAEARR